MLLGTAKIVASPIGENPKRRFPLARDGDCVAT
jgi:hypothetical protein